MAEIRRRRELTDARAAQEAAERSAREAQGEALNRVRELGRCRADPVYWFNTWVWTYNPKLVGTRDSTGQLVSPFLRFKLFPKQAEFIRWLQERIAAQEHGVCEKSRDTGVSYLCAGFALHQWLFEEGFKAGFGSRKAELVDKRGSADSIFEKVRIMLRRLPDWMQPQGFNPVNHDKLMLLENPANGSTITGEGGEEIGRGGRNTFYVVDEGAFVAKADAAEAALSGNTDCVIWVSSVNGMGNLFARKAHNLPRRQVFRLHYSDDPRKTPEWVRRKRESMDPVAWASEYEIDYSASVEGICIPAAWVQSAKRIGQLVRMRPSGRGRLGLDVGAGKSKSVAIARRGPVVTKVASRRHPDTTETALWALGLAQECDAPGLNFDAPGVGAGVSSTLMNPNMFEELKALRTPSGARVHSSPINTGVPPTDTEWPDEMTAAEKFGNLKAELWWTARMMFQRTHEHVLFIEGREGGKAHRPDDLIFLPSGDPDSDALALQLSLVKWFRNERGKIVIETKEQLRRRNIPSPDYADAFMLTLAPTEEGYDIHALAS